ncbi:MAG: hypothetical protein ACKV2T_28325 [Kofleriaceae bacterium]
MRISRRTRFALPLVVVAGCGSPPKSTTPPTTHTEPNTERPTATEPDLPPPPGSGAVTRSTTQDGVIVLAYESGDLVFVRTDGTCFAEYSANCGGGGGSEKADVQTCNPPPPQQVKCPGDAK